MSWNRIVIQISIILSLSISAVSAKEIMSISEDEMIMRGLLYDEYRAYESSRRIYAQLFDTTGSEAYLYKEVTASLLGKTHIINSIDRLKKLDHTQPHTVDIKRLLIPLYLTSNQINLAKTEAKALLEFSTKPIDLELASKPFLYSGEYQRALALLNKAFSQNPEETLLLRIVEIMTTYTKENKKALQLLETYRRMHHSTHALLVKLLVLYSQEKNTEGMLEIYTILYTQEKDPKYLEKIIGLYSYKHDIKGAILFLEKHHVGYDILYELYKSEKLFDKAIMLTKSEYIKDNDPIWLAERGILLFEKSKDKENKQMLQEVIALFEKALFLGVDDSIYLNYYGYTLIDKELDVDRGIKIIENALIQQPHNTYYLDSLAWGYYKKHACKNAYKYMKRVVDEEGLKELEIVEHWEAIKACQ